MPMEHQALLKTETHRLKIMVSKPHVRLLESTKTKKAIVAMEKQPIIMGHAVHLVRETSMETAHTPPNS